MTVDKIGDGCKPTLTLTFCVSDKTVKLWKVSERDRRPEGYNLKDDCGLMRDPTSITTLRVPVFKPMELMVEASPRRVFANAHTYHINSISVNSDQETYMSADDLRINLWHLEITDQSFSILFTMVGGGG